MPSSLSSPLISATGHRYRKNPATAAAAELSLVRQIRQRAARRSSTEIRLGIGDDCAILRPRNGEEFTVTTDLSLAGRHFRLDSHQPESIGHRTLARGLSDLAAMGARAVAAFLSLGLPRELTQSSRNRKSWLDRFLDGFLSLADAQNTQLAGGDLSESPLALADIVLIGAVPKTKALLRSSACAGNALYVTGKLGGAAAALAELSKLVAENRPPRPAKIPTRLAEQLAPHLYPQPRIAQGLWLQRRHVATSAMDLSDGLSLDLARLCEESSVAAEVDAETLPIHPAATLAQALHGGEDYELLFTAPEAAHLPRSIQGVPITKIGRIVKRRANRPLLTLRTAGSTQELCPQGWEHFRS